MINTTIGKYKITRLIDEGGMASVYEAEHEMLGTKVAVKVLNPVLSANAQIRERFKNEAKMMASFNHPNITKIIDFDDQPHQLSIVMEFLEGEDLNDKIKRNGPLSQKEVRDIFVQTLSAFQYAHEKGVVHRDIKPSNIYVLPNGQVKILDFGIAKLFGQGNEMTQTGTQMGTPIYMSPEQVRADKSIDHRSDIYSLGVTMFYALNGKPPYNSDTDSQFDIFNKIVFEPLPELPDLGNFDDFVKKACQKDREQRFQSCEEWIKILKNNESSATLIDDITIFDPGTDTYPDWGKYSKLKKVEVKKEAKTSTTENSTNKKRKFVIPAVGAILVLFGLMFYFNQSENITDVDGNIYSTVLIGKQTWMVENLNVSRFNNGDVIPEANTVEEWIRAGENEQPAWCYYENKAANGAKYGRLYNWYAVNDPRGLAPEGYRIPSDADWDILVSALGGDGVAGIKLKSKQGWEDFEGKSVNGSDDFGFSGLPGGNRYNDGEFFTLGEHGYWWTTTERNNDDAYFRLLEGACGDLYRNYYVMGGGLSVRCLKD